MKSPQKEYDAIVIGSGPAGQRAAIQAAKLGKSVLMIEKKGLGGACLHAGTIPSKTLREAALAYHPDFPALFARAMDRKDEVISEEVILIREQMERNKVECVRGEAKFVSPLEIEIQEVSGVRRAKGTHFFIATGTRPYRPPEIQLDRDCIFDSDSLLLMHKKPGTMAVLGAGVIGSEYASIFNRLGVQVTLIDARDQMLSGFDPELIEALKKQFGANGIRLRLGCAYSSPVLTVNEEGRRKAALTLAGKQELFDAVLICMGRQGNSDALNLAAAGLKANDRGIIPVNRHFQTGAPHIYAIGDIIGSPGLASASAEQGRLAASHALGLDVTGFPDSFPYGIYTIPEISCVGLRESDLNDRKIPYVVGQARYRELARGKILGDDFGFLKLLFHRDTTELLGVHIIGTSATELVHIGQAALVFGAKIDFFIDTVFNYPTFAEAYKVAAYRAMNQMRNLLSEGLKD